MNQQESNTNRTPSAFISYSWDSPSHREWVIALAKRLRENGIEVVLDYWHLQLGADKAVFMENAVQNSDHVLLICTPNFKSKADGRIGGVGWEASIVTGELANDLTQTKFIPLLREGDFSSTLPRWLTNRVGVDLRGDPYLDSEFEGLLRNLHSDVVVAPPIGPRPLFRRENSPSTHDTKSNHEVYCAFSPRGQLISKELSLRAFPIIDEGSWSEEIEWAVLADTSEVDSFFSRLRGHKDPLIVAYGFDVAVASVMSLNRISSKGKTLWKAKFQPSRTDFSNDMEMGTTNITADQFAEKRVRRLLLNENPMSFKAGKDDYLGIANEAMSESLLQGLNSLVRIQQSGFIDLYADFGIDRQKFIEIAWISAITDLKLSAAVQHIDHLFLKLDDDLMTIDFSGRRHRKYANVPPYEITVQGTLHLARARQSVSSE